MDNIKISYKEGIRLSMEMIAKENSNAIFLGYNVKHGSKGDGAYVNIPEHQLFETPVAENLMMGIAIGLSLEGYLPIVYYERFDFILNALDAIVNHLDKIEKMSKGEFKPKVIIRAMIGGKKKPFFTGLTHIQDFTEAIRKMVNFQVWKIGENWKNYDPRFTIELYKKALKINKSVLIIEEKDKYDK